MAYPETGLLTSHSNAYMVLHEGTNYMADIQALRWESNSVGYAGVILFREIFQEITDWKNLSVSIYVDFEQGNGPERILLKEAYVEDYQVGNVSGFFFKEYEQV